MKDCDSVVRSNKKANGRSATSKFAASRLGPKNEIRNQRAKKAKKIMGASSSKSRTGKSKSKAGKNSSGGSIRKGNKQSPELRPRRRASQTYFFKYQLAKNPFKAEEEDLRLALLASLQQCANKTSDSNSNRKSNNNNNNSNHTKDKESSNQATNHNNNNNHKSNHHNHNGAIASTNGNGTSNNSNNINVNTSKDPNFGKISTTKTKQTPIQRKDSPEEENLKTYKPETEDFLTFICFRSSIANSRINLDEQSPDADSPNQINDNNNLKQCNNSLNKLTNINNSPANNNADSSCSPNNHRRPTRQSPRLASSNRKISENDSTSNTAYDNSITYEEDMKRASIALEDMAQEINSSDDVTNEIAQNSPFKNNKHLVKGLMTREFAGAFADEQTIFESISNHKL